VRFDEFGIGTRAEVVTDNGLQNPANSDVNNQEHYMLMLRKNGTNFFVYQRASTNVAWHATGIGSFSGPSALSKFANQPMQVGVVLSAYYAGTPCFTGFSEFMLDLASPTLKAVSSGTNITLSWPGSPALQLESTTGLNPANWQPVAGTPTFTNGTFNLTLPVSTTNTLFRLQD